MAITQSRSMANILQICADRMAARYALCMKNPSGIKLHSSANGILSVTSCAVYSLTQAKAYTALLALHTLQRLQVHMHAGPDELRWAAHLLLLLREYHISQVEAAEGVEDMEQVQLKHLGHGAEHLAGLGPQHEHQLSILAQPVDESPRGIGHGWQLLWIWSTCHMVSCQAEVVYCYCKYEVYCYCKI